MVCLFPLFSQALAHHFNVILIRREYPILSSAVLYSAVGAAELGR
jgi:hypothetical protein